MKKLLFVFLLFSSYLVPDTIFAQSKTYFHDRVDTTIYATTTGTNTYTGTNTDPNFNVGAYMRGLMVSTFIVNGNTGAATYRLVTRQGTLASVAIKKQNGAALVAGDIPDSTAVLLLYYGSFWRLEGLYSTATSAWSLTGNVGTTAGTNFLGTTDAVDLVFKTNNTEKARISSAGIFSLGLASTNNGSLLFRNSTNANTLTINSGVTAASHSWTLPTAQGAANSLLLNDGSGVLSWNTGLGLFWGLTGNAGTTAGTNFIGTTDAVDFVAKTNATERMRIKSGGNVGIGTSSPNSVLTVEGDGLPYLFQLNNTASGGAGDFRMFFNSGGEINFRNGSRDYCTVSSIGNVNYFPNSNGFRIKGISTADADVLFFCSNSANTHAFEIENDATCGFGVDGVSGTKVTIRGSGATSASFPIKVQNSTPIDVFSVNGAGAIATTYSINATAGDAITIDKPAGQFVKDASGTTFTLTNALITANSQIFWSANTTGITTGYDIAVVAGAGSAVFTFQTAGIAAAPSANMAVTFFVLNY